MTNDVSMAIHKTSTVAAAIAAVLSPIPLADELVLVPVYAYLAKKIGTRHGLATGQIPWRPITRTSINGLTARAGVNLAVSFIPGVAAVANAASAVLLTEFMGRYIDTVCKDPGSARAIGVAEILAKLRERTSGRNGASATAASA